MMVQQVGRAPLPCGMCMYAWGALFITADGSSAVSGVAMHERYCGGFFRRILPKRQKKA